MRYGRILAGLALVLLVLASPLAGLVGVAAWQHYRPDSLRAVMHEVAAFTESGDPLGGDQ